MPSNNTDTSTKLKIGFVLDTSLDKPDGVQQYVISMAEWLRTKGHDVHYLVGETHRTDLQNIHSLSKNFSVQSNGNRTTIPLPTSKRKLKAFLQRNPFDVLHVQTPYSPFMAQKLLLAADRSTAIIGTYHIVPYTWVESIGTKLLGYWLRPSLKRITTMLSVSSAAQKFALQSFGVQSSILPNVIDYELFARAKPFEKYTDKTVTILFLGRLVQRKGCMTLLQAIALIKDNNDLPKFRVVVCGKGHLEKELRKYIYAESLEDIVELTGFVEETDKPRYYASADISVFPSSGGESFGIVLLEALASGNAVVLAGDNAGYRSVMEEHEELLFQATDPAILAEKLRYYLTNSSESAKTRKWGKHYAATFDVNVVGEQLLNEYWRALRKVR